jgi:hypothetical protein
MGKRSDKAMKKQKQKKERRPLDAAVASARAVKFQSGAEGRGANLETLPQGQAPDCVKKMASEDPIEREGALQDLTHLFLVPRHRVVLANFGAVAQAAALLCNDELAPVRAAAACALRNVVLCGDDGDCDTLYPNAQYDLVGGITRCLAAAIHAIAELERNGPQASASAAPTAGNGEDGEQDEEAEAPNAVHEANVEALYKDVEEFLQLATVLAEANDAAAEALASAQTNFLPTLMDCLACNGRVVVQQTAAECLKVLSEESEAVAAFMASGLSPDAKAFLDDIVRSVPSSPSLLRVSVNVCGALLNVGPTVANAATVLPTLLAAIAASPAQTVQRLVPLLSAECSLEPTVRLMGVAQNLDRLRAVQAALQALTDVLSIVCEGQDDDLDDEQAFATNPAANLITSSSLLPTLVLRTAEVMMPPTDPVLRAVLFQPADSGDVATLQRILASIEVGVLSLTSSFMLLLPLQAFGSLQTMWQLIVNAIAQRQERLNDASRVQRGLSEDEVDTDAAAVASSTALLCLPLQLESLAEMAATVQRKDDGRQCGAAAGQLDVFTRLAWNPNSSMATRSHVITVVGHIGRNLREPRSTYSCAKFCNQLLTKAIEEATQSGDGLLTTEVADIAAEALDALMDLFSSEDFDDNCYVPLGVDASIRQLLPLLKRHVQAGKAPLKRGTPAWLRKRHLDEVASNTSRFLQYKRENCPAIANATVGQKHRTMMS